MTAGRARHQNRPNRKSVRCRIGEPAYRRIVARDGGCCVYCGASDKLELDHLVPRSKGGQDSVENLVQACRTCNNLRRAMTLTQWAAYAATTMGLTFTARQIRARAARLAA
jgi:5-methylcytosine-specific restriction endonuclease McrA